VTLVNGVKDTLSFNEVKTKGGGYWTRVELILTIERQVSTAPYLKDNIVPPKILTPLQVL